MQNVIDNNYGIELRTTVKDFAKQAKKLNIPTNTFIRVITIKNNDILVNLDSGQCNNSILNLINNPINIIDKNKKPLNREDIYQR